MLKMIQSMFLLLGGTFLFPYSSEGQTIITVKDKIDSQPIEYAQVALLRINQGASTDENGRITLANYPLTDTVTISSLGYKPQILTVKTLVESPIIYMIKQPFALSEVVVRAKRSSAKVYKRRDGWFNDRVSMLFNLGRTCPKKGMRSVVWIDNKENKIGQIEEIIVPLLPRPESKEDSKALIRVCALTGKRETGPERDATIARTVFTIKAKTQTLHINLREQQLYLPPGGGFVGIEWLDIDALNIPVCLGITNSDLSDRRLSDSWQSYRGKKWGRFGVVYGRDGKLQRISNANVRIDVVLVYSEE